MTGTIPTPPPERAVSPERRDAVHDEVRRQIAAARRRPARGPRSAGLRRHLLPLVAAAAVLVVLGATVTVLALVRGATEPAPPAHRPSSSPSPSPSPSATVPGFTPAQRTQLRTACVTALKNDDGRISNQKPLAREFVDLDALRLLNAVTSTSMTAAVLTDGETLTFCSWHPVSGGSSLPPAGRISVVGYRTHAQWLPSPITMELAVSGGKSPFSYLVVGRTVAEAATVTVTAGDGSATVPVVDGTFAASFTFRTQTGVLPDAQAFARDGTSLGEWHEGTRVCAVDPAGNVVYRRAPDDPEKCTKAIPWR